MKYLLEYNKRNECWDIYDMKNKVMKYSEPERVLRLNEDEMDALIDCFVAQEAMAKVRVASGNY